MGIEKSVTDMQTLHESLLKQEAISSLYSGLQKYSEWCMVNLALKKRTERSLSF